MKKKALIVGCNYPGSTAELAGCVNDAFTMCDILVKFKGFKEGDIRILVDTDTKYEDPTGKNIRDALRDLVRDAQAGDVLFFHFSGHGTQVPVLFDPLEKDGMNEAIVPTDLNLIIDNDLKELVNQVPQDVSFTIVTDCCHSGGLLDHEQIVIQGEKKQDRGGFRSTSVAATARELPVSTISSMLGTMLNKDVSPRNIQGAIGEKFGGEASKFLYNPAIARVAEKFGIHLAGAENEHLAAGMTSMSLHDPGTRGYSDQPEEHHSRGLMGSLLSTALQQGSQHQQQYQQQQQFQQQPQYQQGQHSNASDLIGSILTGVMGGSQQAQDQQQQQYQQQYQQQQFQQQQQYQQGQHSGTADLIGSVLTGIMGGSQQAPQSQSQGSGVFGSSQGHGGGKVALLNTLLSAAMSKAGHSSGGGHSGLSTILNMFLSNQGMQREVTRVLESDPDHPSTPGRIPDEIGVLITGCQSRETSADVRAGGHAYGALTNAIHQVLSQNPNLSYFDLVTQVRAELQRTGMSQNPCLECSQSNAGKPFIC